MTGAAGRCFLAIALPKPVRIRLGKLRDTWREQGLKGAWVPDQNYHITARFLGDIDEEQRARLDEALGPVLARCGGVELRIAGTGAFPNPKRPRVIWAGLDVLAGDPAPLLEATESAARAIGLPAETRPPHPHVSLMRIRRPPAATTLADFFARTSELRTDAFTVRTVALWRSTLRPGGAVYEQLKEYPLT